MGAAGTEGPTKPCRPPAGSLKSASSVTSSPSLALEDPSCGGGAYMCGTSGSAISLPSCLSHPIGITEF